MTNKGWFIAYEGIDGCGKSTQIKEMASYLTSKGREVKLVIDPGTTLLGIALRQILKGRELPMCIESEALLFTASRAQLAVQVREYLDQGYDVLSDRWVWSTILYQTRSNPGLKGPIIAAHEAFVRLDPDFYIHLSIDAQDAMKRLEGARRRADDPRPEADRFESEGVKLMEYLEHGYQQLGASMMITKRTQPSVPGLVRVNANESSENVFKKTLELCSHHPLFAELPK